MTKRKKIILFFVCLVVFLLAAPVTIFYSQGYRFDFEDKKITKTGGLFLKAIPKKTKIYINGRFKEETDFLFGSALIENLLPGKYKIEVKKEGFQKWEKELPIKEKQVTEAKNIILWPENLSFQFLSGGVKKIFLSPDKKKAVFLETQEQKEPLFPATSTPPRTEKKQSLKLYDLERKVKSHLLSEDDFKKRKREILNVIWQPDSQGILLETASQEQVEYWLLKILPQPKLIPLDFLPKDISAIQFYPDNPDKLLFQTLKRSNLLKTLFEADLKERKVNPQPLLDNFVTLSLTEKNLFFLGPDGFFYKTNLQGERKEKINQKPLSLKKEVSYKILSKGGNLFFLMDSDLFWFNEKSGALEKIFSKVSEIKFAPDNKKMALTKDHEIWLYFLEEELSQPQREKNEKVFLTRFSDKIGKISWLNSHYLLFNIGDKLKIIETDNRDRPQIWEIGNQPEPQFSFNPLDKRIYLLSKEKLLRSEPLF